MIRATAPRVYTPELASLIPQLASVRARKLSNVGTGPIVSTFTVAERIAKTRGSSTRIW